MDMLGPTKLLVMGFSAKNNKELTLDNKELDLDILSLISHELKTPLTTLKLNTHLLKKQLPSQHHPIIEVMDMELDWMARLISDTLDIKKMGKNLQMSFEWQSWNQIVQNVEKKLEPLVQKSETHLKIHWDGQDFQTLADPMYLEQVLMNFIVNAIEHSRKQDRIELSWELDKTKNQKGLQVKIEDQGAGIASADLDKIFRPLYRSRKKDSSYFKGSGLGLSIARQILLSHGGNVKAMNRPNGKGAIFLFTLPQVRVLHSNIA